MRLGLASGYASGGLIQRLRQEFGEFDCETTAPGQAEFRSRCGEVRFGVGERIESHFLLQLATAEFICRCPGAAPALNGDGESVVAVRHRGRMRRAGVEYRAAGEPTAATRTLEAALSNAADLNAALLPLDFTHCRIHVGPLGVELRMRHFGACEIVGQLPRFRRYVRLGRQQREAILDGFGAFRRVIEDLRP